MRSRALWGCSQPHALFRLCGRRVRSSFPWRPVYLIRVVPHTPVSVILPAPAATQTSTPPVLADGTVGCGAPARCPFEALGPLHPCVQGCKKEGPEIGGSAPF